MSQIKTVKIKDGQSFRVINESDFDASKYELCEGEVLTSAEKITLQLTTELSPELQKTIDDAKAECEKIAAENDALVKQVGGLQAERDALLAKIQELEAKLNQPTDAKSDQPDLLEETPKEVKKGK